MKAAWYVFVLTPLIFLSACASDSGSDNDNEPLCRETLENRMDATLSDFLTDTDFTLYLEAEDGGVYQYNKGASTLSTSYESASTSKWITATIILRIVDQGLLSLEDHPQKHIAGWSIDASDPLFEITLADLLNFTSGLVTEPPCINLPNFNFAACVRQIAEENAGNGRIPGEEFNYGSAHMQVAGLMAIRAAGVADWQELFYRFQDETGLFPTAAYDLPSSLNPRLSGGMHWRAEEYVDFIREFQFGNLLTEKTKKEMMTDQIADAIVPKPPSTEEIDEVWHYGFGIWLECPNTVFDCSTIAYYSSPGTYGAYPFMNMQNFFFGILARQGKLRTFSKGKAVYDSVADIAEQWAVSQPCQ